MNRDNGKAWAIKTDKEDLKHRVINELQHILNLSEDAALGLDVTQKIRASVEQIALDVRRI